ncbi:MAG: ribonuclease J [Acidobacteria bacterium]|nr:ribonuclease J [Acidobacteriota bacterium]
MSAPAFEAWSSPPGEDELRLIPIGGLGEFGMNSLVVHRRNQLFVVDCGQLFPGEEQPGIDRIIPDFAYLEPFGAQVEAVLLTHGHEDHIGALPYFLRQWPCRVYGTAFTLALVAGKLREQGLKPESFLVEVGDYDRVPLGEGFEAEWIPVTHSIPQACSIALHTPWGTVLHSGDFKLDPHPVDGRKTGLRRLRDLGRKGIRVLLSDSTNPGSPGHSSPEQRCVEPLRGAFSATRGKLFLATFSSHIHRIQILLDLAYEEGRKVCLLGRSMERNVRLALDLGLLHLPDDLFIEGGEVSLFPPGKVLVLCTGSQGEPQSALARLIRGEVKGVKLLPGDRILLSSRSIPGNEVAISRMLDAAARLGAETSLAGLGDVHVSGHGCREDLRDYLKAAKPQYFVPVHGTYRHLQAHARIAEEEGWGGDRILMLDEGQCLQLFADDRVAIPGAVPVGKCFVDEGVEHMVDARVVRDRLILQEDGIIFATFLVDRENGGLAGDPTILSRGFVVPSDDGAYAELLATAARRAFEEAPREIQADREALRETLRLALRRVLRKTTQTRPLVVPVILEV